MLGKYFMDCWFALGALFVVAQVVGMCGRSFRRLEIGLHIVWAVLTLALMAWFQVLFMLLGSPVILGILAAVVYGVRYCPGCDGRLRRVFAWGTATYCPRCGAMLYRHGPGGAAGPPDNIYDARRWFTSAQPASSSASVPSSSRTAGRRFGQVPPGRVWRTDRARMGGILRACPY